MVANIILNQIKTMDKWAFGDWGSKDFVAMKDGLKFKTSGMVKWKGYVYVQYNEGSDLYNVIFGKIIKHEWKVQKQVDDVYFDQLVDVIDSKVLKGE
jgi:hypothetical protein